MKACLLLFFDHLSIYFYLGFLILPILKKEGDKSTDFMSKQFQYLEIKSLGYFLYFQTNFVIYVFYFCSLLEGKKSVLLFMGEFLKFIIIYSLISLD